MRISDWSSDVCSSDLQLLAELLGGLIGLQLDQLERRIVIALEDGFGAPIGGDRLDGEGRARLPVDHTSQTPDTEIRARRIGCVEGGVCGGGRDRTLRLWEVGSRSVREGVWENVEK